MTIKKSVRIGLAESYETYFTQVSLLPGLIASEGEILYDRRNLIKRMTLENDCGTTIQIVVKKFRTLGFLRGFIDLNFRNSKAFRSMNNAKRLLELGVQTPDPIGCIEHHEFNCVRQSYYISRFWEHNYDLGTLLYRDISIEPDSQMILGALASFTVKQHDCGILHLDYNPGNILTRLNGDKIDFSLVDLNRIRFTQLGWKARISGLVRLSLCPDKMRIIGSHYAKNCGINQNEFCRQLEQAHSQFWNKRMLQKRMLSVFK